MGSKGNARQTNQTRLKFTNVAAQFNIDGQNDRPRGSSLLKNEKWWD
jgi:hypothetical protein